MQRRSITSLRSRALWLAIGFMVLAGPSAGPAFAETCVPAHDGTCNGHPPCDPKDKEKHCRDTLTRHGYICECRTGKDMRGPEQPLTLERNGESTKPPAPPPHQPRG